MKPKGKIRKTTITVQIAPATNKRLDEFCKKQDHGKGSTIDRAINEYLDKADVRHAV